MSSSTLNEKVFLVQTDTTVGFLSQDDERLEHIKSRLPGKQFLKVYSNLKTYQAGGGRVPNAFKATIRRAEKTTFIVKGEAFRIVAQGEHHNFLKRYGWMYSTSANQSGHSFERTFCESNADIIVEDSRGLSERGASRILRLGNAKRRRLR